MELLYPKAGVGLSNCGKIQVKSYAGEIITLFSEGYNRSPIYTQIVICYDPMVF